MLPPPQAHAPSSLSSGSSSALPCATAKKTIKSALRSRRDPASSRPPIADWLLPELDMIVRQELHERETLLAAGYRSILTLGHSPMTATSRASCTGEKAAANANELRLLSQATNQFQMLEDDLLTCVECDRLLYLSGVTCVMGGPRPRAGQTAGGGGYRAKQLSAPHQPTAHDSAPLSACLSHAHSLHQMCSSRQAAPSSTSNGGNLAVGSNIEHPDGSVLTPSRGATLVTWRRHNDEFFDRCVHGSQHVQQKPLATASKRLLR